MSIMSSLSAFVKKAFVVLLALIVATTAVALNSTDVANNPIDRPVTTSESEWLSGYKAACRKFAIKRTKRTTGRAKKIVKAVLLAPLCLFMGVAVADSSKKFVKPDVTYMVEYVAKDKNPREKEFKEYDAALSAYMQIKKVIPDNARQISSLVGNHKIVLLNHNWSNKTNYKFEVRNWLNEARTRLEKSPLNKAQVEEVLKIRASELRKIVASRNVEKLCEIKGIAEKSALRIITALKPICRNGEVKGYTSQEFTRLTIVDNNEGYIKDTIRKTVTPLEAQAIALGGKDAVIHCVSVIEDGESLEEQFEAETLSEKWAKMVHNGIVLNNKKYVPLGHGTNSAKQCKTIWVLEEIYPKMKSWCENGVSEKWLTTVAKKFAYTVGLNAVGRKYCGIPFVRKDFAILDSVFTECVADTTKVAKDGSIVNTDKDKFPVNRTDGYFIIDIPDQMVPEILNRMILRGDDPEEAAERLDAFRRDTSVNSYRATRTALKGLGDKRPKLHEFLYTRGINKTPDGRPLSQVAIFADKTVIKTNFGKGKAFASFDAWCDADKEDIKLGICVKAHKKTKKDTSYQVVQALCEASKATVAAMAKKTIDYVNNCHTVEGASKLIGKEKGYILRVFPELANVRIVKEELEKKIEDIVNDAFSGKLLNNSYYAFISPDPFVAITGWFKLQIEHALNSGEFNVPGVRKGKLASWRSPVMHPNAVRPVNNVDLPKEYARFMKSTKEFVITMNSIDDISTAQNADWDGDHGSVSDDESVVDAVEETQKVWNRCVIWDVPETSPSILTRKDELKYIANLTHTNELGLVVYGINALLNMVMRIKTKDGEWITKIVRPVQKALAYKVYAANVLVDSGKHGGDVASEPEESAASRYFLQPWAKTYRDAVENKHFFKVYYKDELKKSKFRFFEFEKDANEFAAQIEGKVVNNLNELASLNDKMERHCAGTLNQVFWHYAEQIDRSTAINGVPSKAFDVKYLMFNPADETSRTMTGLFRAGKMPYTSLDGRTLRPDQGLFDSIARRFDEAMAIYNADEDIKDREDTSFIDVYRANALAEIETFAESYGKTLEDAYDVITFGMFTKIDARYATTDGHLDWLRDQMWRAYWAIFGGMACDAASRFDPEMI